MIPVKRKLRSIDIHIETEQVALSRIYVNGRQVFNVHSLTIYADINNHVEVVFGTYGEHLNTEGHPNVDIFLKPRCPKCGFVAPEELPANTT